MVNKENEVNLHHSQNRRSASGEIPNKENSETLIKDFHATWGKIKQDGILRVFELVESGLHEDFNKKTYMDVYTTIYNMSTQPTPYNWSGKLYYSFSDAIAEQCSLSILPRLKRHLDSIELLQLVVKEWENYLLVLKWSTFAFRYLNKFYAARLALPSLHDVGIMHFRDHVFRPMSSKLTEKLLRSVLDERTVGGRVSQDTMRKVKDIYLLVGMNSLRIYRNELEALFLKESTEHMKTLSAKWLRSCTCVEYLGNVERQYKSERARVARYLHPSTEAKLMSICVRELISSPVKQVIDMEGSGCRELLSTGNQDGLRLLFQLYKEIPLGIKLIAKNLKLHLHAVGSKLMEDVRREASNTNKRRGSDFTSLKSMVGLYNQYRQLTKICFHDHLALFRSLKDAFEQFLNFKPGDVEGDFCIAERLSEYLDKLLRGSIPGVSLTSPLTTLHIQQVGDLFSFVNDKDVFGESYRKRLAKRLLLDRSSNEDLERTVVETLRKACGGPFVSKIAGIMKDIVMAQSTQSEFADYCKKEKITFGKCQMKIKVLTSGCWPTYKKDTLVLPPALQSNLTCFEAYYNIKTAHRTLTWIHSLGTMEVDATLQSGRYDLVLNTYQGCVMLLFNGSHRATEENGTQSISMSDICAKLGMGEEQLRKHVVSLAFGKYKLLQASSQSLSAVNGSTRFSVNTSFADKSRRIKVPLVSMGKSSQETDKEKEVNLARINEERKHVIEATVVRIMKVRKKLAHAALVSETTEQLSSLFKVDLKLLKARLEDLISRDYIERDEQDKNCYLYVA